MRPFDQRTAKYTDTSGRGIADTAGLQANGLCYTWGPEIMAPISRKGQPWENSARQSTLSRLSWNAGRAKQGDNEEKADGATAGAGTSAESNNNTETAMAM